MLLTSLAIDNLGNVMHALDPLQLLWQTTTGNDTGDCLRPSSRKEIVVPAGTSVRYGIKRGTFGRSIDLDLDWTGIMIADDPTKTTVDVLLFGIGLCEIDRSSLPNERPRSENPPASLAQNLETRTKICALVLQMFGDEEREAGPHVDDLLAVVGSELTDLSLSSSAIDDHVLDRCLVNCPQVQRLRLVSCRLSTMDPLLRSYERGGRISKLNLSAIDVQPAFVPHFEAFLRALLLPSAMKRTFKKLRIGHQWADLFCQSTADILTQVLNDTLTLDFLHMYRCESPRAAPLIDWDLEDHDREIIPVIGLPPLHVRVAFASVFKHRDNFASLDTDLIATIFAFVGTTKKRLVISEVDGYFNTHFSQPRQRT